MIAGAVEQIGADGVVAGWVQDSEDPAPAILELRRQGHRLARARASEFRAVLLASGRGHGHFGFHARLLHTLPPGPCEIEFFLPRHGRSARVQVVLPELDLSGERSVEQLLAAPPGWREEDVAAHPAALGLSRHRAALGTARFVDRLYRFALGRWPAHAEGAADVAALEAGRLTSEDLLRSLLAARRHENCTARLPSPFDPEYPFPLTQSA